MAGRIYYELPNGRSVTADEKIGYGLRTESQMKMPDSSILSNPEDQGNVIRGKYGSIRIQPRTKAYSLDEDRRYIEKELPKGRRAVYATDNIETVELPRPRGYTEPRNYQKGNVSRRETVNNDPYDIYRSNVKNSYPSDSRIDTALYMVTPPIDPSRTGQGQKDKNQMAYASPNINDYLDAIEV